MNKSMTGLDGAFDVSCTDFEMLKVLPVMICTYLMLVFQWHGMMMLYIKSKFCVWY